MHYDVNGIDRWALGFWNYRARFTNILWLKRIRKCELSHIQMGAIFLSSYFYFRIEWELPAGLVGTLARCQDWFRLVPCRQLTERLGMKEKCTLCKKNLYLHTPYVASLWLNLFPGSQEYNIVYWAENFFLVFPPWLSMLTNWRVRVGTLIGNWLIGSFHLEKDPHQLLTTYACEAVFSDCLSWLRISTFQERSRIFPEPAVQTSHYGENVSDCVSDSYKPQIGNVIMFFMCFRLL